VVQVTAIGLLPGSIGALEQPMRLFRFPVLAALALGGCGVGTMVNVVTAPVRVAGKAVDLATTSQSEADEKRGRDLRRLEARYAELERDYRKEDQRCTEGSGESCAKRDSIQSEMNTIRQQSPFRPD
jgi:hypothetical protein